MENIIKYIASRVDSIESSSKNYWIISTVILSVIVSLILSRYPDLIFSPRFWAEEIIYLETFFHANSQLDGFDRMVYPSYYNLLSRVAGFFASLVELEFAPIVTTFIGFLILMTPIIIIFMTDCSYWSKLKDKIILSLFLIFSCSTGEIWLNSTNLHFIFPVTSFLILLDDNLSSKVKRFFYSLLIGVGSLTGPITLLMSPFFLLRYWHTRNKQFAVYCAILLVFGLLHVSYYLVAKDLGMMVSNRLGANTGSSEQIAHIFSNNIIFPVFGYFLSIVFRTIADILNSGIDGVSSYLEYLGYYFPEILIEYIKSTFVFIHDANVVIYAIFFLSFFMFIYYQFKRASLDSKLFFILPFFYLSIVMSLLSLKGVGGFRYSYITGFILLFYLYNQLSFVKTEYGKRYLRYILMFSIIIGMLEYYPRMISYTSNNWPIWKEEVGLWRVDDSYNPRIWPSIKKSNGLWPERMSIWYIDLNKPRYWDQYGNRRFSTEVERYFVDKN
ncbi:hypothetical protein HOB87_10265 [Candidatus Woesearchaeota archaeon]|nr:hypothetical protein [Candidatus Woesearchaeota archaeon]MBT4764739.1 hypothetical protein [bacterium]MBT7558116.1 hypothetical protein [Candidatus Woesearchaeota archaeon]